MSRLVGDGDGGDVGSMFDILTSLLLSHHGASSVTLGCLI